MSEKRGTTTELCSQTTRLASVAGIRESILADEFFMKFRKRQPSGLRPNAKQRMPTGVKIQYKKKKKFLSSNICSCRGCVRTLEIQCLMMGFSDMIGKKIGNFEPKPNFNVNDVTGNCAATLHEGRIIHPLVRATDFRTYWANLTSDFTFYPASR